MRFKSFIKESLSIEVEKFMKKAQLIDKDCRRYLSDIDYNLKKNRLLRGIYEEFGYFIKKKVRKNRRPLDTPLAWQKAIDEVFKKHKIPLRSQSIFTVKDFGQATPYGPVYLIFPIGNYRISYNSRYTDLQDNLLSNLTFSAHLEKKGEKEEFKKLIEKKVVPYQHVVSAKDAITKAKKTAEIMIECDSYYGVSMTDDLKYMIRNIINKKNWNNFLLNAKK